MTASEQEHEPEEKNSSGRGALSQNSNIPLGWKPTDAKPVPVVRCTQIKKDGNRCGRWSIRGYTKCIVHAGPGALMKDGNVRVYSDAVIEAARIRLIDEVDPAIDGLVSLTQPGTSEQIRLKAYTEILDRAGIRGGFEVQVEADITANPSDELRKRLSELQAGATAVKKMKEGDVVDAELVEDDPEQPSLFELEGSDDDE